MYFMSPLPYFILINPSGVASGPGRLGILLGSHPSALWPAPSEAPQTQLALPHRPQTEKLLEPSCGRYCVLILGSQHDNLMQNTNSKVYWLWTTLVCVCLLRASESGRARAVEGAAAVNVRAVCSNAQQKPSREGQPKNNCLLKPCTCPYIVLNDLTWMLTFSINFLYI